MSAEAPKRPYRKRRRAELEDETRRRIAASAMELHGSVGPAHTSITAVADRAGVRRSTVYRHFPDEAALFAACSALYDTVNPPPDPGRWAAIGDPDARLVAALSDLYAYYRRAEPMLANVLRDEPLVAALGPPVAALRGFLATVADELAAGRPPRPEVRAATGHAVAFSTWRSLVREEGLDDARAVQLMRELVAVAGRPAGA